MKKRSATEQFRKIAGQSIELARPRGKKKEGKDLDMTLYFVG